MGKTYKTNRGKYAGGWEVQSFGPLDNRGVIDSVDDLIDPETWRASNGVCYHYNGMPVKIKDTGDEYTYIGADGDETQVKSMDYWVKGSGGGGSYSEGDAINIKSDVISVDFGNSYYIDNLFVSQDGDSTNTVVVTASYDTDTNTTKLEFLVRKCDDSVLWKAYDESGSMLAQDTIQIVNSVFYMPASFTGKMAKIEFSDNVQSATTSANSTLTFTIE